MGGRLSAATRTVPNSKRAITSPPQMAARPKSYIRKQAPAKFKRWARNGAACARDAESFMASKRWACASILIWQHSDLILAEMSH
jgi:hypothetical protein